MGDNLCWLSVQRELGLNIQGDSLEVMSSCARQQACCLLGVCAPGGGRGGDVCWIPVDRVTKFSHCIFFYFNRRFGAKASLDGSTRGGDKGGGRCMVQCEEGQACSTWAAAILCTPSTR